MEIVVLKMLFIVSVSAKIGKHVHVTQQLSWVSAQEHCRDHYTDMSPVTTQTDRARLENAATGSNSWFWIGLYKEDEEWWWSGGGLATNVLWDEGQPNNQTGETVAIGCGDCSWDGWHDYVPFDQLQFFCLDLIVVGVRKSWEEALEHCRDTHTDLTSLASDTDHLLALSKIQQDPNIERVWIGLRYLGDRWLWVNGDPLVYEAWPGGDQDHKCPIKNRCGALTEEGLWEGWDCEDKLYFICY